jgi:hypothetical protein
MKKAVINGPPFWFFLQLFLVYTAEISKSRLSAASIWVPSGMRKSKVYLESEL